MVSFVYRLISFDDFLAEKPHTVPGSVVSAVNPRHSSSLAILVISMADAILRLLFSPCLVAGIRLFYSTFETCLGIVLDKVALPKLIRQLEASTATSAFWMMGFSLNEIFLLLLAGIVIY